MQHPRLSVRLQGKPIGTLSLKNGTMSFSYEQDATRPLSLSMPIQSEPYKNRACEAFFGGLLPEDWNTKRVLASLFGINSNSNYDLLERIGRDCAGAVSIQPESDSVICETPQLLHGRKLNDETLHELLNTLPERPLLAGIEGIRISLAGAQQKAALCLIDDDLCIPAENIPSTHILKPRITRFRDSVPNEYFCMKLAKLVGLAVSNVEIRSAKDIQFLLIERYDRKLADGMISRIHQEDFCQAMGIVSTKKYQADGGPTLARCFQLLDDVTFPAVDKIELLKRVVFNFIVANADCHGKNFSVMHYDDGRLALAPVYDVLCTSVYSAVTSKFAMSIGGEMEINSVRPLNWEKFCKQCGVHPSALKRTTDEMSKAIRRHVPVLLSDMRAAGAVTDLVEEIATVVTDRIEMLHTSVKHVKG